MTDREATVCGKRQQEEVSRQWVYPEPLEVSSRGGGGPLMGGTPQQPHRVRLTEEEVGGLSGLWWILNRDRRRLPLEEESRHHTRGLPHRPPGGQTDGFRDSGPRVHRVEVPPLLGPLCHTGPGAESGTELLVVSGAQHSQQVLGTLEGMMNGEAVGELGTVNRGHTRGGGGDGGGG